MIYINGKFLCQNITGVQRYAIEMIKELDQISEKNEFCILVPNSDIKEEYHIEQLKNIAIRKISKLKGILWEQLILGSYCILKKKYLINLTGSAPIMYPSILVEHDINFVKNKKFFDWRFSFEYNLIMKIAAKKSKVLFTVSEFSKKEISEYYNIEPNKIYVTYNGWQHLKQQNKDYSIIEKLNLEGHKFYFLLGSMNLNKNVNPILEIAQQRKDMLFVVTGKEHRVFNKTGEIKKTLDNVIFTGYLSDNEIAALYEKCFAFVFPSIYEGFGIPPMEALANGCRRIVMSDTSALPEIYGKNVTYVNPYDKENILYALENCSLISDSNCNEIMRKYSWKDSAQKLYDVIKKHYMRS